MTDTTADATNNASPTATEEQEQHGEEDLKRESISASVSSSPPPSEDKMIIGFSSSIESTSPVVMRSTKQALLEGELLPTPPEMVHERTTSGTSSLVILNEKETINGGVPAASSRSVPTSIATQSSSSLQGSQIMGSDSLSIGSVTETATSNNPLEKHVVILPDPPSMMPIVDDTDPSKASDDTGSAMMPPPSAQQTNHPVSSPMSTSRKQYSADSGDPGTASDDGLPLSHTPQHLQHETLIQPMASPYIVAVPHHHEATSQPEAGAPQPPTLFYSIPGVVTVPVAPGAVMVSSDQQPVPATVASGITEPTVSAHIRPPAAHDPNNVVGMMGAIPIVKMQQAPGMTYVKKKKGRFNLLQETPTTQQQATPAGTSGGGGGAPNSSTQVPTNITVPTHTKGRSSSSALSQLSGAVGAAAAAAGTNNNNGPPPKPQTFDGTRAPSIKKKGRFVVTNVKDPGSISRSVSDGKPPPSGGDGPPSQQNSMPPPPPVQQQTPPQPVPVGAGPINPPPQQVVIPTGPAPSPHPANQSLQQTTPHHQHTISNVSSNIDFSTPEAHGVFAAPGVITYATPAGPMLPVPGQHFYHVHPQAVNVRVTPPLTPDESPLQNGSMPVASLPNVPFPKAPGTVEKGKAPLGAKKPAIVPKKTTQRVLKNGIGSNLGLGKLNYFLDQMKREVGDADLMIRTLQTDMKLLRDKNKELESKNRDMEKKLREERVLREKAEGRNMELRKRIREGATNELTTIGMEPAPHDKASRPRACSSDSRASSGGGNSKEPGPVASETAKPEEGAVANGPNTGVGVGPDGVNPSTAASDATEKRGHQKSNSVDSEDGKICPEPRPATAPPNGSNGSGGTDPDYMTIHRAPTDSSIRTEPALTSPSKSRPPAHPSGHARANMHPPAPLHIRARSVPSQAQAQHQRTHSATEFDPMKASADAVYPVYTFPTQMSLGSVPINAAQYNAQAASEFAGANVAAGHIDQNGYVSGNNSVVVPIHLGMTSAAVGNEIRATNSNDFQDTLQHQPFMVLPHHQQPFMLQQVHQIPMDQYHNAFHQQAGPPQPASVQQPVNRPQSAAAQSFEGYSPDPFDDLLKKGGGGELS